MIRFIQLFLAVIFSNLLLAQKFDPTIICNGGGLMSNANAKVTFTIGEAVTGKISNSTAKLTQGFQQSWMATPSAAGTITGPANVCQATSHTYSVAPIANATSYIWTLPSGVSGTSIINNITVFFSYSSVSGNITVEGQNPYGTGPGSSLAIAISNVPTAAGTITGPSTVCKGASNIVYYVPVIPDATSYIWSLPAGANGSSNTNSILVNFDATAQSGNVTVRGNNTCGDGLPSSLAVSVLGTPAQAGAINGNTSVCKGSSNVIYTVADIPDATSYIWTLPTGATGSSTTNSISVSFSNSAVSGNIKVKGSNTCGDGLESSLPVTLNDIPPTPSANSNGITLHSSAAVGNQWYFNSNLIPNATGPSYDPTQSGNYYVVVTLNGCPSAPSNTIAFVYVGVEEFANSNPFSIFPNPTTGFAKIKFAQSTTEKCIVEVMDMGGKTIMAQNIEVNATETQVNLSTYPANSYILKVSAFSGKLLGTFIIQKQNN